MAFFSNTPSTSLNAATSAGPANLTATLDVEVADPPTDSISSIQFSPQTDLLAVGSWDSSVRVYEIGVGGTLYDIAPRGLLTVPQKEGRVFSGGVDGAGRVLDVATGQAVQVAQHDAPIKVVKWVDSPGAGILATGSWDKTIKCWDLRQSNPVATINLQERCYTFDVKFPLMIAGTADRGVQFWDVNNLKTVSKVVESPLKWQTRVVTCLPNLNTAGYAIGSVEGKVAIQYIDEKNQKDNLVFKCHRRDAVPDNHEQNLIYPVNDISFHPIHGTFSTAGSDGTIHFWDKDSRQHIKTFVDCLDAPVSSTAFNHNGTIFAYAVSYDWYKGHMGMVPGHPNKIMLHAVKDEEVTSKRLRK